MKTTLKFILIAIMLGLFIAQLFRPDRTNPAVIANDTLGNSTTLNADVEAIVSRSCSDCHSHETIYPWYSNISPFSWFLEDHIEHGRSELNFSVWNTYSPEKKIKKLEEICEQVESRAMPLPSYLWIHREAALNDDEAKLLCNWAKAEKTRLEK